MSKSSNLSLARLVMTGVGTALISLGMVSQALASGPGARLIPEAAAQNGSQQRVAAGQWHTFGDISGGCDDRVNAMIEGGDGRIYLAGSFTRCGSQQAFGLAAYDPIIGKFSALGTQRNDQNQVVSLAWFDGKLIAGGYFGHIGGVQAAHVASWDGSTWSPLGSGTEGDIHAMLAHGGSLYIGGNFFEAGGVPALRIAHWNGMSWSALGQGIGVIWSTSDRVNAMIAVDGDLIIGGDFNTAEDIFVSNIARWNGSNWQAMGTGVQGTVESLALYEGNLVAGGGIHTQASPGVNRIARWDGTAWTAIDSGIDGGFNDTVYGLAVHEGNLVAAGRFSHIAAEPVPGLAQWNGSAWEAVPGLDGARGNHRSPLSVASGLYVANNVTAIDSPGLHNVARYHDSTWTALEPTGEHGFDGLVTALTSSGSHLHAAGVFRRAGEVSAQGVAEWDGLGWRALGNLDGPDSIWGVYATAIASIGSDVYVGGNFNAVEGAPATGIARWDGEAWHALSDGISEGIGGTVRAIVPFQGEIVVGGNIDRAGSIQTNGIARWSAGSWRPLLSPNGQGLFHSDVRAVVVHGNRLVVGGYFDSAGGLPMRSLAFWNGTQWTAPPEGLPQSAGIHVDALAVYDGDLYVAGWFPDQNSNFQAARLRGSQWEMLHSGQTQLGITSMLAFGDSLYLAGGDNLTSIGGVEVDRIARWNGHEFQRLPGEFDDYAFSNPSVHSLTAHGGNLLVGGGFRTIGSERSAHIAGFQPDVLAGIDLQASVHTVLITPSSQPTGIDHVIDIGNRGAQVAGAVNLSVITNPTPLAMDWTCVPLALSTAQCPETAGSGSIEWTMDLPPGPGLRLLVSVQPEATTAFQRLKVVMQGQPAPDGENNASAELVVVTPFADEAIFSGGFENHH